MDNLKKLDVARLVLAALLIAYLFFISLIVTRYGNQAAYMGLSIVAAVIIGNVARIFMVAKDRVTSAICCAAFLVPAALGAWALAATRQGLGLFNIILAAALVYLVLTEIYILLGLPEDKAKGSPDIESA